MKGSGLLLLSLLICALIVGYLNLKQQNSLNHKTLDDVDEKILSERETHNLKQDLEKDLSHEPENKNSED
jgi:cytochrome c-type biogenesis protein CcmH/NrfG